MVAKKKLKKIKKASEIKIENNAIYHNNKSFFYDIDMKLSIRCPYTVGVAHNIKINDCTDETTVKDLMQKIKAIFNSEEWRYYPMKLITHWGIELTDMEETLGNYHLKNYGCNFLILTF